MRNKEWKEILLDILIVIITIVGILAYPLYLFLGWYSDKYGCNQDAQCITIEPKNHICINQNYASRAQKSKVFTDPKIYHGNCKCQFWQCKTK